MESFSDFPTPEHLISKKKNPRSFRPQLFSIYLENIRALLNSVLKSSKRKPIDPLAGNTKRLLMNPSECEQSFAPSRAEIESVFYT